MAAHARGASPGTPRRLAVQATDVLQGVPAVRRPRRGRAHGGRAGRVDPDVRGRPDHLSPGRPRGPPLRRAAWSGQGRLHLRTRRRDRPEDPRGCGGLRRAGAPRRVATLGLGRRGRAHAGVHVAAGAAARADAAAPPRSRTSSSACSGQLVRRLTEQAGDLVFLDLPGRLAKLLLQLVGQHGAAGSAVLDRRLTQSDLAAMIGASRPAVNRALQSLAARGYLTVQGQAITLRDVEGLRRRAEV